MTHLSYSRRHLFTAGGFLHLYYLNSSSFSPFLLTCLLLTSLLGSFFLSLSFFFFFFFLAVRVCEQVQSNKVVFALQSLHFYHLIPVPCFFYFLRLPVRNYFVRCPPNLIDWLNYRLFCPVECKISSPSCGECKK
ncbi:hypothetical protein IWZ03DRAFT_23992 [Phyllosticta citriasiana]|uniref:Uncharacterized protein n=1 Tax=Phyllosticta citriasiana TaxID=595635 RepID=A0ABR1L428_9PEZI